MILAASETDIKNGDLITDEEVNREEDLWLNKQFGQRLQENSGKTFSNIGLFEMAINNIAKKQLRLSEAGLRFY